MNFKLLPIGATVLLISLVRDIVRETLLRSLVHFSGRSVKEEVERSDHNVHVDGNAIDLRINLYAKQLVGSKRLIRLGLRFSR